MTRTNAPSAILDRVKRKNSSTFFIRKSRPEVLQDLLKFEDHVEARRFQDPGLWHYHQRHIVHFIQQVTPGGKEISGPRALVIPSAPYCALHTAGNTWRQGDPGPRALVLPLALYCELYTVGNTWRRGDSRTRGSGTTTSAIFCTSYRR